MKNITTSKEVGLNGFMLGFLGEARIWVKGVGDKYRILYQLDLPEYGIYVHEIENMNQVLREIGMGPLFSILNRGPSFFFDEISENPVEDIEKLLLDRIYKIFSGYRIKSEK